MQSRALLSRLITWRGQHAAMPICDMCVQWSSLHQLSTQYNSAAAWHTVCNSPDDLWRGIDLWEAAGDPCAACLAHDLAPGGERVAGNALRHIVAVEAQVRQQRGVEALPARSESQHEAPRRHAGSEAHLQRRICSQNEKCAEAHWLRVDTQHTQSGMNVLAGLVCLAPPCTCQGPKPAWMAEEESLGLAYLAPVLVQAVLQALRRGVRELQQLWAAAQRAQRSQDVVAGLTREAVAVQQRPQDHAPQLRRRVRLKRLSTAIDDLLQRLSPIRALSCRLANQWQVARSTKIQAQPLTAEKEANDGRTARQARRCTLKLVSR